MKKQNFVTFHWTEVSEGKNLAYVYQFWQYEWENFFFYYVQMFYFWTIYWISYSPYILPFDATSKFSRSELGLPDLWSRIESWMKDNKKTVINDIVYSDIVCKNPEFPVLASYREKADRSFWDKFPSKELPYKPTTKINIAKLEEKIIESKATVL